jgi:hypothetical protein
MLRQLFVSGAVAACNMEVLIAMPKKNDAFAALSFGERGQWFDAARFTRINPHLNQVAL